MVNTEVTKRAKEYTCTECKQKVADTDMVHAHVCDSGEHWLCDKCWKAHERGHEHERLCMPTVHLNGTSREELIRQRVEIGAAMIQAVEVLSRNGPHERDYYVKPGSWEPAKKRHGERIRLLDRIFREVRAEYDLLAEEDDNGAA